LDLTYFSQERKKAQTQTSFPYSSTLCSQHHIKKQIILLHGYGKLKPHPLLVLVKQDANCPKKEISTIMKNIRK